MPGPGEAAPEGDAGPADIVGGLLRTTWPWLLAAVAAVGFFAFLLWGSDRPEDPEVVDVTSPTTPADGVSFGEIARMVGEACLKLLVADTPDSRASGLRHREHELQRVDGMLFVADQPTTGAFTMAGVVEPLQIGFYDAEGTRIGGHLMQPCAGSVESCPTYPPPAPWVYAIETAPGELPEGDLGGTCEAPAA